MDLICYLIDDHPADIRPARNRRRWMNETPGSYAYRCLPLSIANAHGWEVRCPATFDAEWSGGSSKNEIHLKFETDPTSSTETAVFAESHFGDGILTFNVRVIIETPRGYDLWVTGPVNEFKDGIQAMSAVIESYWMPFTFTMNWKFTRPHWKVRFEKGEPFCFFFPIEHGLVERFDPTFAEIGEAPDLEQQYKVAFHKRLLPHALKTLKGKEIRDKDRFDGWYIRGEMPDGAEVGDHRRRLQIKPFETRRGSPSQ